MKRLKYILPLLLILVLGTALPGPAEAEGSGWSWDDSAQEGVTLTAQGGRLQVTLDLPEGEYTVWLVEGQNFDPPIHMDQYAGKASFQIPLESRLKEIDGRELTLWVFGTGVEISLPVRYDAPAQAQTPSPSPPPTASPAPTPSPPPAPQGGTSSGGGSPAPAETPRPSETPGPAETPRPDGAVPHFTDMAGHWGESYVTEAAARGLFSGYDDGRFAPDDPMTRAQFITVLWRMAGRPGVTGEAPFTDIGGEIAEFRSAIAWGYDRGYISGDTEHRFAPSDPLTREQAMKILYYFSGSGPGEASGLYEVYDRGYTDSSAISSWAREPMYWGVYNRIISGAGDGLLAPQGTATRAQLAKILIVYTDDVA